MDNTRKIQCNHCRQRLSLPKENEEKLICPACTLETPITETPKPENERSSISCNGREHSFMCPKRILNKLRKPADVSTKTPLNIEPSPFRSSSRPNKRAVLCGVTYNKRKYRLKGTINDVKNMRDMLIENFKFQENGIIVLTDLYVSLLLHMIHDTEKSCTNNQNKEPLRCLAESSSSILVSASSELAEEETPEHIPTKKNIEKALKWLVEDCKKGDSLVFYFSGHGLRQPEFNGDETDGFDETICPLDFIKEGMIIDNDINSIIVKPLVKGVRLHAIVDACHSGTILDLKYKYNRKEKSWDDNTPPSGADKATRGGLAISISACADDQVASDTTAFSGNTMNGAMTYMLTSSVRKFPGLTYGDLLDLIHEEFEKVNKNDCLVNTNFLKRFYKDSLSQKPLLSSSECFDAYKEHFIL
ncbi:hypothetical protein EZV62_019203 [Acer yangbiense]|uniref:Peptidase C14 caspase domain-containing protein n=1 Tax=Acer yangbiense TaxID=1000413 RepID=A0A5C7HAP7_9ROSI|nr:hypothetical protein EZV62_019203 [Acer yangbiense]